jgi:alkylation response protein AidB-like acyl-CoA dehydrogenase
MTSASERTGVLEHAPDPAILASVRGILRDKVEHLAEEVDELGTFPAESYQALARAGLAGLLIPHVEGGQQASTVTYAAVIEEIAAVCASTSTVYMTQMHCAYPILVAGSPAQRQRYLPGLCSGTYYGAIAVSEPDAGSDAASMRTSAVIDGDAYVINGQKIFISNGDRADVVVVFATMDRSRGKDAITAFVVERGSPGFTAGQPIHKLGQRGASTVEMFFSDCRVPLDNMLGPPGSGFQLAMRALAKSRISAAAQGVGFARGAYEAAARHFARRGMLDASSSDAQDVQFELAGMYADIAAARALLWRTALSVDTYGDDAWRDRETDIAVTKLHCTDLSVRVAAQAARLLGEDGDRSDLGVERRLRDAKVTQIYDGTNQIQRMLIARAIRRAHA